MPGEKRCDDETLDSVAGRTLEKTKQQQRIGDVQKQIRQVKGTRIQAEDSGVQHQRQPSQRMIES
jgi:hypothetical protein